MSVDVQALVDQGYLACRSCRALNRPERRACFVCGVSLAPEPAPEPAPRAGGGAGRAKRPSAPPSNPQGKRGRTAGLGWFADHPHGWVDLVVAGEPIAEGSGRAVAPGVVLHDDKRLHAWRKAIRSEAERVCGPGWVAVNAPVSMSAVFTVPRPVSAPSTRAVPADSYRDKDKLVRAVGDGLSPKSGFRMLASDMRIVGEAMPCEKTYPRPLHTHPCALDEPGLWVRIQLAVTHVPRLVDGQWMLQCPISDPEQPLVSGLHPGD